MCSNEPHLFVERFLIAACSSKGFKETREMGHESLRLEVISGSTEVCNPIRLC